MRKRVITTRVGFLLGAGVLVPLAPSVATPRIELRGARMAVETRSAFAHGDTLAFRFTGRVPSRSPNAQHLVFEGDLTSLATGGNAGGFTWDLTCGRALGFPCGLYESRTRSVLQKARW